jgi:hypothetical protein
LLLPWSLPSLSASPNALAVAPQFFFGPPLTSSCVCEHLSGDQLDGPVCLAQAPQFQLGCARGRFSSFSAARTTDFNCAFKLRITLFKVAISFVPPFWFAARAGIRALH